MVKQNHEMVVTVASYASSLSMPNMTDYAASKAAALSFHEGLAAKLTTKYKTPEVRTTLIILGYTKPPPCQGYNSDGKFRIPTSEPERIAAAIVKQVFTGRSGQVIVSCFGNLFTLFGLFRN